MCLPGSPLCAGGCPWPTNHWEGQGLLSHGTCHDWADAAGYPLPASWSPLSSQQGEVAGPKSSRCSIRSDGFLRRPPRSLGCSRPGRLSKLWALPFCPSEPVLCHKPVAHSATRTSRTACWQTPWPHSGSVLSSARSEAPSSRRGRSDRFLSTGEVQPPVILPRVSYLRVA